MASSDELLSATVESLSHDGRGVARIDGKVVFINDALPGETISFRRGRKRRRHETGTMVAVTVASPDRVAPKCPVFGVCGGCALQHLDHHAQLQAKHRQLVDNLERLGKVQAERYLAPLSGPIWDYRRRARLGVRMVPKKGGVLVGFRERQKSYVTPTDSCDVLHRRASGLLTALQQLISALSCPDRIPQIEVAVADNGMALVFRHLVPLSETDLGHLRCFGADHQVQVLLQPQGVESVHTLWPDQPQGLHYRLDAFDVDIHFRATDFIQVNGPLNAALVGHALALLDVDASDSVLDLFCGVGNFTLPLARSGASVLGLEGDQELVRRARENAEINRLPNARFAAANLYQEELTGEWLQRRYSKILLDPPRSGAMEVLKHIPDLAPRRIVYVSCNPATLARDAELLVHKHDYHLRQAGIVDMFPHTAHVESIAVFDAPGSTA